MIFRRASTSVILRGGGAWRDRLTTSHSHGGRCRLPYNTSAIGNSSPRSKKMAVSASADTAAGALVLRPGRAEIRQEALAPPRAGEVRVRALYGAISRGTEALVFAGRVPESEFERMRAPFMGGEFPFPVKYGYAAVGRVEDGPVPCAARSSSRSIRIRPCSTSPASAAVAAAGRRAAAARGAGRQYGDRAQRRVGRGAGPGRPHRRRRRRRRRLAGRLSVRAAARRRGDAGRHQSGARGIGAGARG